MIATYELLKIYIQASNLVNFLIMSFVLTNSVILTFIGDPYVTGSGIASSITHIALTEKFLSIKKRQNKLKMVALLIGLNLAWTIFLNQRYIIFLFIASIPHIFNFLKEKNLIRFRFSSVIIVIVAFIFSCLIFLKLGKTIFPNLDWLKTTVFYGRILNPSDYASSNLEWAYSTWHIFPLAIIYLFFLYEIGFARKTKNHLEIGFVLIYTYFIFQSFILHSTILEASYYNAMLMPVLIAALISYFSKNVINGVIAVKAQILIGLISFSLLCIAGKISIKNIFTVFAICSILIIVLLFLRNETKSAYKNLGLISIFFICIQAMQSVTIPGVSNLQRHNFNAAFNNQNSNINILRNVEVEKWVINETNYDDSIFVWVEPNSKLVSVAAMQLWGPNSIETPISKTDWNFLNLTSIKPNRIVLYFRNYQAKDKFLQTLEFLDQRFELIKCKKWQYQEDRFSTCIVKMQNR